MGSSFACAGRCAGAVEAFGSLASSACADGERKAQATGAATRNESGQEGHVIAEALHRFIRFNSVAPHLDPMWTLIESTSASLDRRRLYKLLIQWSLSGADERT